MPPQKLLLAIPRGFCAGVVRAHDLVVTALRLFPEPVYVLKEIVHNREVVQEFQRQGVTFVPSLEEVPEGSLTIFSAHGVSPQVRALAETKRLRMIDATCPLVTKVHLQVRKYAAEGYSIILVGHEEHDEVIGTRGEASQQTQVVGSVAEVAALQVPDSDRVLVVTQTTRSVDDTREIIEAVCQRFPKAIVRNDICFATQNRQSAVKAMAAEAELILVVGSSNSSNSNRLCEVARAVGARSYLVDHAGQVDPAWLEGIRCVGLTAGASTPDHLVQGVVAWLLQMGVQEIREVEVTQEDVTFGSPHALEELVSAATSSAPPSAPPTVPPPSRSG